MTSFFIEMESLDKLIRFRSVESAFTHITKVLLEIVHSRSEILITFFTATVFIFFYIILSEYLKYI